MRNSTRHTDDELTTFADVSARWCYPGDEPDETQKRESTGYKIPTADYSDIDEDKVGQAKRDREKVNALIGAA